MTEPEGSPGIGKSTVRSPGSREEKAEGENHGANTDGGPAARPVRPPFPWRQHTARCPRSSPVLFLTGACSASTLSVRMCLPNGPCLTDIESPEAFSVTYLSDSTSSIPPGAQPDVAGAKLFISFMFLTAKYWRTTHQRGTG